MIAAWAIIAATGAQPAPALGGLDPVELCRGSQLMGSSQFTEVHAGRLYTFASARNRDLYRRDPDRWGPQIGGACGNMGPLSGRGTDQLYAVHDGRIWLFASDACRRAFLSDPPNFVDRPDPAWRATPVERAEATRRLDAMARAHGGWDRLDAARRLVWVTRTVYKDQDGKDLPYLFLRGFDSGKSMDATEWPTGFARSVSDGKQGRAFGTGAMVYGNQERTYLERMIWKHPLVALKAARRREAQMRPIGPLAVDGVGELRGVELHDRGATCALLMDPKSGEIRATRSRDRAGGPYRMVTRIFTDYREVAGVRVPGLFRVSYPEQRTPSVAQAYFAYRINAPEDAPRFRMSP